MGMREKRWNEVSRLRDPILLCIAMLVIIVAYCASAQQAIDDGRLARVLADTLSREQLDAYLAGAYASEIVLPDGQTLEAFLAEQGLVNEIDLSWFTSDSGGGESTGGAFDLFGSIGQPDAGVAGDGVLELRGGFVPGAEGRCASPLTIFCDGFETGDTSRWNASIGRTEWENES